MNRDVAEQNHADEAVGALQQFFGIACATATVLGHVSQTIAIECHQSGFGTGEKPGGQNQQEQNNEERRQRKIVQGRGLVWPCRLTSKE